MVGKSTTRETTIWAEREPESDGFELEVRIQQNLYTSPRFNQDGFRVKGFNQVLLIGSRDRHVMFSCWLLAWQI